MEGGTQFDGKDTVAQIFLPFKAGGGKGNLRNFVVVVKGYNGRFWERRWPITQRQVNRLRVFRQRIINNRNLERLAQFTRRKRHCAAGCHIVQTGRCRPVTRRILHRHRHRRRQRQLHRHRQRNPAMLTNLVRSTAIVSRYFRIRRQTNRRAVGRQINTAMNIRPLDIIRCYHHNPGAGIGILPHRRHVVHRRVFGAGNNGGSYATGEGNVVQVRPFVVDVASRLGQPVADMTKNINVPIGHINRHDHTSGIGRRACKDRVKVPITVPHTICGGRVTHTQHNETWGTIRSRRFEQGKHLTRVIRLERAQAHMIITRNGVNSLCLPLSRRVTVLMNRKVHTIIRQLAAPHHPYVPIKRDNG